MKMACDIFGRMHAVRTRCRASLATAVQDASGVERARCAIADAMAMVGLECSNGRIPSAPEPVTAQRGVPALKEALFALAFLCATLTKPVIAAPVPDAQPIRGGTLRVAMSSDMRSLDPAIAYDYDSIPMTRLLFRGLLEYDDGSKLVPGQIVDWNISSDGKTYTFHLKPGVKFANGREVEAEDYVFSFERILNPATDSPGQGFFTDILGAPEFAAGKTNHVSGLSAPDERTLVIKLQKPLYTFRYVLAMSFATVVPRDVVQQFGKDFQYQMAGSGPYKLVEIRRGIRWRLVRNPYYTGPDGYVDAVDVLIIPDNATETMMLERNEVDRVWAGPSEASLFARDPRRRSWLVGVPTVGTDYIFMNTEMKPFDNRLVRQAINYAINKERLIKLAGGFGTVADGIVPPAMPWTNATLPYYHYDPAKARALLRQAGYPNGLQTTLAYLADQPVFVRMAAAVQQDLKQVGIDVSLRPANFTAFDYEATTRRQVPCGMWAWSQDYPDPSDFLDVLFNGRYITETDCNNTTFYNNAEVNSILDQAGSSMNEDERTRLYEKAEDLIMEDAPWAPTVHEVTPILYNPRVHGTRPHPVWLWRYEWMWLDPQK
ncbi:MAG TPA: ABC transporter substrate-binding protein [Verrucomicrobiae bacterium]|nr:ABC transporter substrate-binding protein [Verrucomicrobiae bacterium]